MVTADPLGRLLARAAQGDPAARDQVDAWRRVTARLQARSDRAARDRALRMTQDDNPPAARQANPKENP